MLLTVAICTWNRAGLLRHTLDHLTRLSIPDEISWELVVADNASEDCTPAVIAEFAGRLPITYVVERRAGLSNARNSAVRAALGEYVIWTDDDVLVDQEWLKAYASAFVCHPDAAIFGGPIEPWFSEPPPAWLANSFPSVETAFAARRFDGGDAPLAGDLIPFGANMAFRTSVLRDNPFDPSLGRIRDNMLGGEEEVLIRSLLARGMTGQWVSGARVRHHVPPERQTVHYIRRFYEGVGATKARLAQQSDARLIWGRPRWVWQERFSTAARYHVHRLVAPPSVWVRSLMRASMARGRFDNTGRDGRESSSSTGSAS